MRFIVNAPKRRARARKGRRRRSAAQRAATARMLAANKARRRTKRTSRRRNTHLTRAANMPARRKSRKRRATVRRRRRNILAVNPRRKTRRRSRPRVAARRRSRRRRFGNPPAILQTLIQGVMDAGAVVGGEIAANIIANQIPMFLKSRTTNEAGQPVEVETQVGALLRKGGAALLVGIGGGLIFKGRSDIVRFLVAGALSAPVKSFIRPLLPTTGPFAGALSAGGRMVRFSSYPRVGSYPAAYPLLGSYPNGRFALSDAGAATSDPYYPGVTY